MLNQIEICNNALIKLGESTIVSLDQGNKAANNLKALWNRVILSELRANIWDFSIDRITLASLTDKPEFEFTYMYQLPTDCISLIEIYVTTTTNGIDYYTSLTRQDYEINGRQILTSFSPPLHIKYVKFIDNPAVWDASFDEIMITKLALELCEVITQSNTKKAELAAEYDYVLKRGLSAKARETSPVELEPSSWLLGRL